MSRILINKLALAIACHWKVVLTPRQELELSDYWRRTPSNLAYRVRIATGWKVKGYRNKRTGKLCFERTPLTREPKKKIHTNG
jgi:hypothetical protein